MEAGLGTGQFAARALNPAPPWAEFKGPEFYSQQGLWHFTKGQRKSRKFLAARKRSSPPGTCWVGEAEREGSSLSLTPPLFIQKIASMHPTVMSLCRPSQWSTVPTAPRTFCRGPGKCGRTWADPFMSPVHGHGCRDMDSETVKTLDLNSPWLFLPPGYPDLSWSHDSPRPLEVLQW